MKIRKFVWWKCYWKRELGRNIKYSNSSQEFDSVQLSAQLVSDSPIIWITTHCWASYFIPHLPRPQLRLLPWSLASIICPEQFSLSTNPPGIRSFQWGQLFIRVAKYCRFLALASLLPNPGFDAWKWTDWISWEQGPKVFSTPPVQCIHSWLFYTSPSSPSHACLGKGCEAPRAFQSWNFSIFSFQKELKTSERVTFQSLIYIEEWWFGSNFEKVWSL